MNAAECEKHWECSHAPGASGDAFPRTARTSRLWLWFVAAFALQLGAWIAWFAIASQHKVAEVPLATAPGR